MKYITVFCGSSNGKGDSYMKQAVELGKTIAMRGYGLVYGGAHVGLMGAVANGALENNGKVIGVIPDFLKKKELAHPNLSKSYVVETMHERKAKMNELCDAVIALPGGFGTMEELFEMLTWAQLALHKKPIGLLNTNQFYDPLLVFVEKMIESGFLKAEYRDLLLVEKDMNKLIDRIESYTPPANDKWFIPSKIEQNGKEY